MSRDDQQTDKLFDRLAGTTAQKNNESNLGSEVLRDAIRAQIETQRVAEKMICDDLSAEQKLKMDAIKQQLLAQGLIGVASTSNSNSKNNNNWIQRLHKLIFDTGWERPIAFAMSMLFVITIGIQVGLSPDQESNIIVRGGTTPEIIAPNAIKYSEELAESLRKIGAKVLIVKINADDLSMRVDVPSAVDLSSIKKLFSDYGIELKGYPPYRLTIKQSR